MKHLCTHTSSNSYAALSISSGSDHTFDSGLKVLLTRLPIAIAIKYDCTGIVCWNKNLRMFPQSITSVGTALINTVNGLGAVIYKYLKITIHVSSYLI